MYSQFDKSIVSAIMAGIVVLNLFGLHPAWLSQDTITAAVTVLTPLLVLIVPNLPKDKP